MTDLVDLQVSGAVALLTLNDPARRNVLSAAMVAAIDAAVGVAESNRSVRCLVVTGAGPAFCAGAELSTLAQAASGDFAPVRQVYDGFLRVLHSPLATIAAVNGPAVGAGFNLALACDLRLASTGAMFDTRFTALRLHPGGGHTWLLSRAVGYQQAVLACLYGEGWDAEAARAVGLVAAVHAPEALVPQAIALGDRLGKQESDFTRRLTSTLRATAGPVDHPFALMLETEAQQWSAAQPAFAAHVNALQDQIAARRPAGR